MNTKFYVTKATAVLALASLAFTVATASTTFGAVNLPNNNVSQTGVLISGGGGGGLPPEQPGYPPRQPVVTGPVSRTTTKLKIQLTDRSSYEQGYELYRSLAENDPGIKIASLQPFTGQLDFSDSGLSPDTRYCYRLRAFNAAGESSHTNCFSTLDGRGVSRIQLRLRTANVEDAGTDDDIMVALTGPNSTWLDYGRNDFERGDEFTYELLLDGVSDLANIETLYIKKEGTDGWCLESLALIVNDIEIYNENFGSTPSTCRWIDKASGHKEFHSVSRSALRAHPLWQNYPAILFPSGTLLPKEDIEDRIEGIIGNNLHYDVFVPYWGAVDPHWGDPHGGRYVEASKKDDKTLAIDLDFSIDGPVNLDVDVDFDLRFEGTCKVGTTPAELRIIPENVRASTDFSWLTEALTLWLVNLAEDSIAQHIEAVLSALLKQLPPLNYPAGSEVNCVTVKVHDDRSVSFDVTYSKRTGGTTTSPGTIGTTTGTVSGGTTSTGTGTVGTKVKGTVGTISTKALAK